MIALGSRIYLRLVLSTIWMMLSNSYTLASFLVGLLASAVVLDLFPAPVIQLSPLRFGGVLGFLRWIPRLIGLVLYFIYEALIANVQVSRLVLQRKPMLRPGIIRMELNGLTPGQLTLLSILITLTPGTFVMGTEADCSAIYIHALDASDEAETLRVPRRFEQMVQGVIPS